MRGLPEIVAAVLLAGAAVAGLLFARRPFPGAVRFARRLAACPWASAAFVAVLAFAAAEGATQRAPCLPIVHDEHAYLIAGETFAKGRLTIPTHPMWAHFEAPHVLHVPSYSGKYPPGQGLFLALGFLFGAPIAGVWISFALACAAVAWALRAWVGPRWALAGALVLALHPGMHARPPLSWTTTFWGGSVALLGGALVLGAWPRLARGLRPASAVAFGLGAGLLAITRPWEGLVLVVAVGLSLAWRLRRTPPVRLLARAAAPALLALLPALLLTLAHNRAVTGSALRMPYVAYESDYSASPTFIWQGAPPAVPYRTWNVERYQTGPQYGVWEMQRNFQGFAYTLWDKLKRLAGFYHVTLLPLLALAFLDARRRAVRRALGILALAVFANIQTVWWFPHYSAPFAPALFVLAAAGARAALRLPRGACVAAAALLFPAVWLAVIAPDLERQDPRATWPLARKSIVEDIESRGGKHILFVRYDPRHFAHVEWVYNTADIDSQNVILAHWFGGPRDAELADWFRGRSTWVVHADTEPPFVFDYPRDQMGR